MSAARLVILRHGRTEWNATGRFQGHADIELDDVGREQAIRTAAVLSGRDPAAIVSSDLSRATQTAQPLAAATGLTPSLDPRLREIHVGSWEGLTGDEVVAADPDLGSRWRAGEDVRRSATGETIVDVARRASAAIEEIGETGEPGSSVVVVTHGLAARVGVCRLVGFPTESWRRLGSLHNCAWITLDRQPRSGYWRITDYNTVAS